MRLKIAKMAQNCLKDEGQGAKKQAYITYRN